MKILIQDVFVLVIQHKFLQQRLVYQLKKLSFPFIDHFRSLKVLLSNIREEEEEVRVQKKLAQRHCSPEDEQS